MLKGSRKSTRHAALLAIALVLGAKGAALSSESAGELHWSLRPVAKLSPPETRDKAWPKTPIDAFILSALEARGMHPSPPARKTDLIRRIYFDLIGLPPTPDEVDAFAADAPDGAVERVVDELLSRPEYGERWARHWLDVAHYAETHGHDQDRPRTNAWPYRDYVIRAFNQDKPFGRFALEQIAGDVLFPEDPGAIVAMGFLAAGPWDESSLRDIREDSLDRQIARYVDRDDIVTTVMNTFASTTIQCARCHDHKFDPISQAEYYSLQAVFAGTDKANRPYDPDPLVHRKRKELAERIRRAESTQAPSEEQEWVRCAEWLEASRALRELPEPGLVYAGASDFPPDGSFKPAGKPREVHVLKRGDINQPGERARPGALRCLPELPGTFAAADEGSEGDRRAALARWIADPRNALTWRSIVNRVWHYHFGRGLVKTPNDFGRMGGQPSHPELLDWLANWFVENGGSFKKLHKLILTSAVYQQSTQDNPRFSQLDAENTLLWRMNRARLDAESVRDSILAVSGKLLRQMGGPSDKQFLMSPGIHVTPKVDYGGFDVDSRAAVRRSIYRFVFRTLPDPFMDSLDCPDSSQLTPVRNTSVTVSQALAMLNDQFVIRYSEHFAAFLAATSPANPKEQVHRAVRLAYARMPRADELERFTAYVQKHGLSNLCRVLFNSNEFMFVN